MTVSIVLSFDGTHCWFSVSSNGMGRSNGRSKGPVVVLLVESFVLALFIKIGRFRRQFSESGESFVLPDFSKSSPCPPMFCVWSRDFNNVTKLMEGERCMLHRFDAGNIDCSTSCLR